MKTKKRKIKQEDKARCRLIDELEEGTAHHPADRRVLALLQAATRVAMEKYSEEVSMPIFNVTHDTYFLLDPDDLASK